MYKMMNGLYDEEVLPHFDRREVIVSGRVNRKHNQQIFITKSNKEIRANYFTKRVAPVGNSLSKEVINAPSVVCFKKSLDKFWDNHLMKYDFRQSLFNF